MLFARNGYLLLAAALKIETLFQTCFNTCHDQLIVNSLVCYNMSFGWNLATTWPETALQRE